MKILITGGAGYIGTVLIPLLLEKKYEVIVYDNFIFDNSNLLLQYCTYKNFSIIKGDIRDLNLIKSSILKVDIIIHLAAYVGYSICRERGETEAHDVNTIATKQIVHSLSRSQFILFGSTGSNYGEVHGLCTEETPLNPLSIYGRTKTQAEKIVMNHENSIAYRFATAFGISPRLRLDLLINDLTFKAISQKFAVIYESHFLRTFIHVRDIANSFLFAIDNLEKMKSNVYNVGSNNMNYSKREICEIIKKRVVETIFHYADVGEDVDKRNYQVSYDKINKIGFDTSISIEEGIDELIKAYPLIKINSPYHNV